MLFKTPQKTQSNTDSDRCIHMKLDDILGSEPDPDERISMSISEFRSRIQKEEIREHIKKSVKPKA